MVGLADDRAHELVARLRREVLFLEHELGEPADRHQRPAEVVGHDADELALEAVVLLEQRVGLLELVVEAQVLDRDRGLAGEGQQEIQVVVREGRASDPVRHREEAEDLRPPRDGGDHERLQLQLGRQLRQEPGVRLGLVREQRPVLAEVPAAVRLAVHLVAHPLDLLGGEAEAGRLAHQLAPLRVVEQQEPALRLQHLRAVAREVAVEGVRAADEREGPGHLVEPQQLAGLLLQDAPLGELPQEPRHPDLQLGRLERLGPLHVVHLRRRALRVEAVEHEDAHVAAEGLAHALDHRRHGRVAQRVRREEQVGRAVHDALHDPAPREDHRHAVPGRAQQPRQLLGALRVFVDEGDVPERPGGRGGDHRPRRGPVASNARSR